MTAVLYYNSYDSGMSEIAAFPTVGEALAEAKRVIQQEGVFDLRDRIEVFDTSDVTPENPWTGRDYLTAELIDCWMVEIGLDPPYETCPPPDLTNDDTEVDDEDE